MFQEQVFYWAINRIPPALAPRDMSPSLHTIWPGMQTCTANLYITQHPTTPMFIFQIWDMTGIQIPTTWFQICQMFYQPANLEGDSNTDSMFLGQTNKWCNSFFSILSFCSHCAHVSPVHHLGNLNHGQGLEVVRWNNSGEVLEPRFVRQLCWGGGIADLGNLKNNKPDYCLMHMDKQLK